METVSHQLQLDVLALMNAVVTHTPAVMVAILIVIITRIGARWTERSTHVVALRTTSSISLRVLLEKSAATGVWCFGIVFAALIAFPSLRLGDIFATLGLTSVAIGFAFQDIFKNFLAGVLLLLNEPFRIGDQIIVDTYEGTVDQIDIRFTAIRTYAGERILIPNATVFTTPVQVRTSQPSRRFDIPIGLTYGTDLEKAVQVLNGCFEHLELIARDPAPRVDITAFGDSSVNLIVRLWAHSEQADVMVARTQAIIAMDIALKAAKLEIAFPTRTIIMAQ